MDPDDQTIADTPIIRIRAIGDSHVATINIPTGATLEVDEVEVI